MRDVVDSFSRGRHVLARVVVTLAAWFVAFLVVLALLSAFGEQLESLPIVLNALVFTGVLVPVMGNVVMPVLGAGVARWVGAAHPPRRPVEPMRAPTGDDEIRG